MARSWIRIGALLGYGSKRPGIRQIIVDHFLTSAFAALTRTLTQVPSSARRLKKNERYHDMIWQECVFLFCKMSRNDDIWHFAKERTLHENAITNSKKSKYKYNSKQLSRKLIHSNSPDGCKKFKITISSKTSSNCLRQRYYTLNI